MGAVRTILIATPPLLRAGLQEQLGRDPDIELVAAVGSLDELPADVDSPDAVVCAGDADLAEAAAARWPSARVALRTRPEPLGTDVLPALSAREREVLVSAAEGLSTRGIAERLTISEHTVKSHLRWAMLKLGVSTRTAAVRCAVVRGLL